MIEKQWKFHPINVGFRCVAAVACVVYMVDCGKEHAHKTEVHINSSEAVQTWKSPVAPAPPQDNVWRPL